MQNIKMNALAPTSKLCSIFVFDLISNPLEIKRQHEYIYIYNFSKHYKSTLFRLKKKNLFSDKKKKKQGNITMWLMAPWTAYVPFRHLLSGVLGLHEHNTFNLVTHKIIL